MNKMDSELKNKLSWWYEKAKKYNKDHWVSFVLHYLIFDAFISYESKSGNDETKLFWFFNNKNSLKDSLQGCWKTLLPNVLILKKMSPVRDERPRSTKEVSITDENNIEEIFKVIYQVRCNLFHGSKNVDDKRDSDLVYYSNEFLKNAIDGWFANIE